MRLNRFYRIVLFLLLASLLLSCVSCISAEYEEPVDENPTRTGEATTARDPNRKQIALTFDDGPDYQGICRRLVDEFAKYGGRATFFSVGNRIQTSPGSSDVTVSEDGIISCAQALHYAVSNGWEVGIHGFTHEKYFDTCSDVDFREEIGQTKERIEAATGKPVTLLRAPGGRIHSDRATESGFTVVNWSVDSEDWKYTKYGDEEQLQQIVSNVVSNVKSGDIVLMHSIRLNSFEATCRILKELSDQGYEFVTVTELVGAGNLRPGRMYLSATEYRDVY